MDAKPVLKWVGGKTQIMDSIISILPDRINDFYEIFLGGGSVLLNILKEVQEGNIIINNIYAYDINPGLIGMYLNIQNNWELLYDEVKVLINEFVNNTNKEGYYYLIRNKFNKLTDNYSIKKSAMLIFLNKTCFRGLYRVGPNGFNVPYSRELNLKVPEIINKSNLKKVHELIQGVHFECLSFEKSMLFPKTEMDLLYLDPPYSQEKSDSFVGYSGINWNNTQFLKLVNNVKCKFLMNNSNTSEMKEFIKKNGYYYSVLHDCKRRINCKNPEATTSEVLIRNYSVFEL